MIFPKPLTRFVGKNPINDLLDTFLRHVFHLGLFLPRNFKIPRQGGGKTAVAVGR